MRPQVRPFARAIKSAGIVAVAIAMSATFAPSAHAQILFTWEGVPADGYPAPQNGVTVATTVGGQFAATDERGTSPNNVFGTMNLGCNHTVGGSECGLNGHAQNTSIYSIDPTKTFTLNGGYFKNAAGFANSADFLHVFAQDAGGTTIFNQFFQLSSTLSLITFNWAGVSDVVFGPCKFLNAGDTSISAANCYPADPGREGGAGYFLADDIGINGVPLQSTTPEPSELVLVGIALAGLLPLAKRRMR